MAEVKSSLDIALERAAALAGDDSQGAAITEGEQEGKRLGRKAVAGELTEGELMAGLDALADESREAAGKAAAVAILDAEEGNIVDALNALTELAVWKGKPQAAKDFASAVVEVGKAEQYFKKDMARDQLKILADEGISGSAVKANPLAHPAYNHLREEALAPALGALEDARQVCKKVLTS